MTQHVPVPPKVHAVSAPAKLNSQRDSRESFRTRSPVTRLVGNLEFRWEPFSSIARELPLLFKQHWQEIALDQGGVPLEPDWESYYALELRGVLHILTARHLTTYDLLDPKLVGYIFNLIGGHQHYASTRFAHTEMFWLHPSYRKGWEPVRMFKENLAGLKEREAVVSTINFKLHFKDARVGKLLARLGYEPTDIVMRKVL